MHVVITGAGSGIGKALAMAYLQQNCKVSVCARNLDQLQQQYNDFSQNVWCCKADVSVQNDCQQFIEGAIQQFGDIDVLINNAGISMRSMFDGIDLSVIKQVMDINYWGAVYCTYYALPSIKKSKGVICGISSIAGYRGLPARTGYSSSKFALQGFLEALKTELLKTGVHVMWVSPGFTNSNIRNVALDSKGQKQGETPLDETKLMSAETCAELILKAVQERKRSLVMTGQGKLTVFLSKLWPSLLDKLVYNHFKKEADSPLQ